MAEPGTQSSNERSFRKELHGFIGFLIIALGTVVAVKYNSKKTSPFDDHDIIIVGFCVSLCLYAMSGIAEYKLPSEEPNYLPIIKTFGPLIGFLVVVLLLAILKELLGIIAFIIWGLSFVKVAFTSFSEIVRFLCQVFSVITQYFHAESSTPHPQQVDGNGSLGESSAPPPQQVDGNGPLGSSHAESIAPHPQQVDENGPLGSCQAESSAPLQVDGNGPSGSFHAESGTPSPDVENGSIR